jgi:hypothetical protein
MAMIAMTLSIPPDKFARWRQAVAEMAGPRRAEFATARRRQGVSRQAVWVQQGPHGPREILVMESDDPMRAFELMATSQEPFDVWLRELLSESLIPLCSFSGPYDQLVWRAQTMNLLLAIRMWCLNLCQPGCLDLVASLSACIRCPAR